MDYVKNFLKSNSTFLSLTVLLFSILIFWALTKDKCLKIDSNHIKIEVSCDQARLFFPHLPPGGLGEGFPQEIKKTIQAE